jgi:hypothetical protein
MRLLRSLLLALVAGCATPASARVANRIAGTASPCPDPPSAVVAGSSPSVTSGNTSVLTLPLAVGLAVAGASPSTARCSGGAAPAASTSGGARVVSAPPPPEPEPASFPTTEGSGEFVCTALDGEEDTIVAVSLERAQASCAVMTAENCVCEQR